MGLNRDEIIDQIKSQIDFSKFISCTKVLLSAECAQFCLDLVSENKDLSEECCKLLTKVRKLSEENERLKAELADRPPKLVITKVNKEVTNAHPMEQTK